MTVTDMRHGKAVQTESRNGELLAALKHWHEESPAAAKLRQIDHAHETAAICAECGRELQADEPLWQQHVPYQSFVGHGHLLAMVCENCVRALVRRDARSGRCPGCKRPVHFDDNRIRHGFCSNVCSRQYWRERKRDERAIDREGQRALCEGCGQVFAGKRSDALYCSSACRQRAYRERLGT